MRAVIARQQEPSRPPNAAIARSKERSDPPDAVVAQKKEDVTDMGLEVSFEALTGLRWSGDSQRESERFARTDSQTNP